MGIAHVTRWCKKKIKNWIIWYWILVIVICFHIVSDLFMKTFSFGWICGGGIRGGRESGKTDWKLAQALLNICFKGHSFVHSPISPSIQRGNPYDFNVFTNTLVLKSYNSKESLSLYRNQKKRMKGRKLKGWLRTLHHCQARHCRWSSHQR